MHARSLAFSLSFLILSSMAIQAQGPAFASPGQSPYSTLGQTTRFDNEFNPALGFVIDSFADWEDTRHSGDGFDMELRILEFNASAFIDPEAWAYVSIASEDLEDLDVEEAAVEYLGLPGRSTLKAGRFFVDFGKQMQEHLEELRTLERPLPLREFLGEELGGTGVQFDNWFAAGEETPVRFSVGIFAELLPDSHDDEDDAADFEASVAENKKIDELSFTARLTGMTDVGETGQFQLGLSGRWIPDFSFEFDDGTFAEKDDGLTNSVYGLDLTYGKTDETGEKSLLLGGEYLLADGDLAAELDDPVTPTDLQVSDGTAQGFYLFGDYAWDSKNAAGTQFAFAEELLDPDEDEVEVDVYYTRHMTEFRRLRFGVTYSDLADEDGWRLYVQFTNFFGTHSHGLNW